MQRWLRTHRPDLGGVVVYAPHVSSNTSALRTAFAAQTVVDGGGSVQLDRYEDDAAKFLLGTLTVMLRREPHDQVPLARLLNSKGLVFTPPSDFQNRN